MIDDILQNRRYVREYDSTANIPKSLIDELLQRTWKVTPSKNNFMPYTIHVLGPDQQKYKELTYLNAASNEGKKDSLDNTLEARYTKFLPNYANILNCSYLFIFTLRLEDKPNPHQQKLIDRGHKYEAVDENTLDKLYPTASLEVGLFANTFSTLCLEHGIDVSYTGCFHRDVSMWKDIPFVKRKPILIMTVGKGKVYLEDQMEKNRVNDFRPDYHRIVNFIE
jgi:hypothetical protein